MPPPSPNPSPSPAILAVDSPAAAGNAAAERLLSAAASAVNARGRFLLAIPGGSSPSAVFNALATNPRFHSFPWHATHLLWIDERAVPTNHPDSNAGAFARDVLPMLPIDPARLHPMRGDLGPDAGAADYRSTLERLRTATPERREHAGTEARQLALDAVLLGLGEDAHVASLFPGSAALDAHDDVLGITDSPKPPPQRITLGPRPIRDARSAILLALGPAKADALRRCLTPTTPADHRLPARLTAWHPRATWITDQPVPGDPSTAHPA